MKIHHRFPNLLTEKRNTNMKAHKHFVVCLYITSFLSILSYQLNHSVIPADPFCHTSWPVLSYQLNSFATPKTLCLYVTNSYGPRSLIILQASLVLVFTDVGSEIKWKLHLRTRHYFDLSSMTSIHLGSGAGVLIGWTLHEYSYSPIRIVVSENYDHHLSVLLIGQQLPTSN